MATLETPPKTERPPRRGRFSLRWMLIAVALICLPLGWFGNRAQQQLRAVAGIEALGGFCEFDNPDVPPGPVEAWFRERLPRSYFDNVWMVGMSSAQLPQQGQLLRDADLAYLSRLPGLQLLDLCGTPIGDEGLRHLAGSRGMWRLQLRGTQVTDAGLAQLAELKQLDTLWLDETRVSDAGLVHLTGLPLLRDLGLFHTQITDAGLDKLARIKTLQYVGLVGTRVTPQGAARLRAALPGCTVQIE